jgi:hypothetical protein
MSVLRALNREGMRCTSTVRPAAESLSTRSWSMAAAVSEGLGDDRFSGRLDLSLWQHGTRAKGELSLIAMSTSLSDKAPHACTDASTH